MNRSLVEYREARAVELAVQGMTFSQIADELGYASRSGAWKAVRRALKARRHAAVDHYRALGLIDLDVVLERAWGRAAAGDLRAAEVVLRAIEARWRLLS